MEPLTEKEIGKIYADQRKYRKRLPDYPEPPKTLLEDYIASIDAMYYRMRAKIAEFEVYLEAVGTSEK